MTQTSVDLLLSELGPLCGPLHELLEGAADKSIGHLREHDLLDPELNWGLTHLTRLHAVGAARAAGSRIGPWRMINPSSNGRFEWHRGAASLRLLHDPVVTVPAPGHNRARRRFYLNESLTLFGDRASKLLGLWGVDPMSGEAQIRVVRPVGNWHFLDRAKVDLEFLLPSDADELRNLEFDSVEGLYVDLRNVEGEDDGGAGEQPAGR